MGRKINMALQSASTTIKLFSVARSPLISSLSAGSVTAKNIDQKRWASGGNYVYINPIKDNPSWGELAESSARTLFLLKLLEGSQLHLDKCLRSQRQLITHLKKVD